MESSLSYTIENRILVRLLYSPWFEIVGISTYFLIESNFSFEPGVLGRVFERVIPCAIVLLSFRVSAHRSGYQYKALLKQIVII